MRTLLIGSIVFLGLLAGVGWDKYFTLRLAAPPFLSCAQGVRCVTHWDESARDSGWLHPTAYECKLASYALIEGVVREETTDNLVFVNHTKEAIYCIQSASLPAQRLAPDATLLIPKLGDWSAWECMQEQR